MNITFETEYKSMTFKYYLKQPKSLLAWKKIENLEGNPKLMQDINRPIYHPLTYHNFIFDGENQDLEKIPPKNPI